VHSLQPRDPATKTNCCNWIILDYPVSEWRYTWPTITIFTNEAWYYLNGHVNTYDNRYSPLNNPKCDVQCGISAMRIIISIFMDAFKVRKVYWFDVFSLWVNGRKKTVTFNWTLQRRTQPVTAWPQWSDACSDSY
jgi:hypothetical protein